MSKRSIAVEEQLSTLVETRIAKRLLTEGHHVDFDLARNDARRMMKYNLKGSQPLRAAKKKSAGSRSQTLAGTLSAD